MYYLVLTAIPTAGLSQVKLVAMVKSTDSLSVPYCNVTFTRKTGGTYSNESGFFELSTNTNDTLVFSSIGYKKTKQAVSEIVRNSNKVYLDIDITQLQELTVTSQKRRVASKRQEFGYTKTKRKSLISSGIPGTQFAVFIENSYGSVGYIESVFVGIACNKKSRVRLRLYKPNHRTVGEETTPKNIIFDVTGDHKKYKLDLSGYNIPFGMEGVFISLEFLGEVGKDNLIKQATTMGTKLYLTDGKDAARNTWQSYRENPFVLESFSDNQQNTSNALIGLSAIFYSEMD